MRFRSILTTDPSPAAAAQALAEGVAGFDADLAVLFTSHHYDPHFEALLADVYGAINARNLIGCAAESVIGPAQELEHQPAAVLWVAEMPGVRVLPFVLDFGDLQAMSTSNALRDRVGVTPKDEPSFIVIPDPYSIPGDDFLRRLDRAFPGAPIVGGMASGAEAAGQSRLFLNDQVIRNGAVGVSLTGDVVITTVVSQGCRPVGGTFVITACKDNLITELGGRAAYDVLKEVYASASAEEQGLMLSGVHVGRVVRATVQEAYTPGDFLVRNVLGVVGNRAIAVGDNLRRGQTIQFHVRDAETADADMRSLIQARVVDRDLSPAGGLLFTCNGRGARLFGETDHDIGVVNELLGSCAVAGFFAAGEIGPIGNATFVHGLTSSLVVFTPTGS
jgi:small ligand-binding sensory domain FIST